MRAPELNEYLIGREVYSRDDSYDPATDPIVRVGAHSVREKLEPPASFLRRGSRQPFGVEQHGAPHRLRTLARDGEQEIPVLRRHVKRIVEAQA
jgi:hypothetical protein